MSQDPYYWPRRAGGDEAALDAAADSLRCAKVALERGTTAEVAAWIASAQQHIETRQAAVAAEDAAITVENEETLARIRGVLAEAGHA